MNENLKKIIVILTLVIFVVGLPLFFILRKKSSKQAEPAPIIVESVVEKPKNELETLIDSSRLIGGLPTSDEKVGVSFDIEKDNSLIEYISFLDFYKKQEETLDLNISDYSLPLNVKTEVVNYYDISRKINLDNSLDLLNNNGFAVLENSFDSTNFYEIYSELYSKKIPILITSDFLIYYYQHTLKKAFKDVEENIFYANLWEINRFLYERAKNRYEENLVNIGNVNDRVLEAQRLSAAYFATALELLKPKDNQINTNNDISNTALFSFFEADNYAFSLPDYLKVDVLKELEFIKVARQKVKSPVLLYDRDYSDFVIPSEYQTQAKLNNFYLTTQWLSSSFPLYFKEEACPDCQLDFDDWRVSMITSSFIAEDIFDSYELKNKWARIYKTLAFFKGLRGDLTYVHYRDALVNLFGEDYKISEIFADDNIDSIDNLYKFRNKILEYNFLDIEGGYNRNDSDKKNKLGVKMLTDFYWPNDYILNELSYPKVFSYQGDAISKSNITSCNIIKGPKNARCNGFSLDIIALINEESLVDNDYYLENSNYDNYQNSLVKLKEQINKFPNIWHYNNYWKTLNIIKEYLVNDKNKMPIFSKNSEWQKKDLYTSVGAWINLQLPIDKLKIFQKYQTQISYENSSNFVAYNYIEPNLNLINEQISNVEMILQMFQLLKITEELRVVSINLEDLRANLIKAREIVIKELNSEVLSQEDLNFITLLSLEYKLEQAESKIFKVSSDNNKSINYNISEPKLMIIISGDDKQRSFSVGPVFNYLESR